MMVDHQAIEVDRNYDAFRRRLGEYLKTHPGQFALMKNADIVAFFIKPGDAYREGVARFAEDVWSVQEVTDEPIDLGFFSHVGH